MSSNIHAYIPIINPQRTSTVGVFFKGYFNYTNQCYIKESRSINREIELTLEECKDSKAIRAGKIITLFTGVVPMISAAVLFSTWVKRKAHTYVLLNQIGMEQNSYNSSITLIDPAKRTVSLRELTPKQEKAETSQKDLPPSPGRPRPFRIGRHEMEDYTLHIDKPTYIFSSLKNTQEVIFDDDIDYAHPDFLQWFFALIDLTDSHMIKLSHSAIPALIEHLLAKPDDRIEKIMGVVTQNDDFMIAFFLELNPPKVGNIIDEKRITLMKRCMDLITDPEKRKKCIDELFVAYSPALMRTASQQEIRGAFDRNHATV